MWLVTRLTSKAPHRLGVDLRKIHVSIGGQHPARVTEQLDLDWSDFARRLLSPLRADKKTDAGWYCPARFDPAYRDSEHLKERHALTLDYDHVTREQVAAVQTALAPFLYVIYSTFSHTAENPRVRIVMPTTRPMTAEEFCAVSRKVASWGGIELAARESHVASQMMYLPVAKPGAEFKGGEHKGAWLNVDEVLATYDDWHDRTQWPHRKDADELHAPGEKIDPRDKPGVVGSFCRAFNVPEAIERFDLPYKQVS